MKKYFIEEVEVDKETFYSELEDSIRDYVGENYDEMIDDCYEEVEIGCCKFSPSEILKKCDPIAYRCGVNDYVDAELSDANYYLDRGEEYNVAGEIYKISEEDE